MIEFIITILMFPTSASTTYSYSMIILYNIFYYAIAAVLTFIILAIASYGIKLILGPENALEKIIFFSLNYL